MANDDFNKEEYDLEHDQDVFFLFNGLPIHLASMGGIVPSFAHDTDMRAMAKEFRHMPDAYSDEQIYINPNLSEILNLEVQKEDYAVVLEALDIPKENNIIQTYIQQVYTRDFRQYARKGFFSFCRTNIYDHEDNRYHLVACPKHFGSENPQNKNIKAIPESFVTTKQIDLHAKEISIHNCCLVQDNVSVKMIVCNLDSKYTTNK